MLLCHLAKLGAKAKILKFLSGKTSRTPLRTRTPSRASDEVTNFPGLAALFEDEHQRALEVLAEETGLPETAQEIPGSTHLGSNPQRRYEWNRPLPDDLESLDAPSDGFSMT